MIILTRSVIYYLTEIFFYNWNACLFLPILTRIDSRLYINASFLLESGKVKEYCLNQIANK